MPECGLKSGQPKDYTHDLYRRHCMQPRNLSLLLWGAKEYTAYRPGTHDQHPHYHSYPLSSMIQHLLPSRVKLSFVILQQPLLSQGDGLLGSTEHLSGPLEVLCGFLSFQLSLLREKVFVRPETKTRSPWGPSPPPSETSHRSFIHGTG